MERIDLLNTIKGSMFESFSPPAWGLKLFFIKPLEGPLEPEVN